MPTAPTTNTQLIDISEEITQAGYDNLKKGQILTFVKDGVLTDYKIARLNKTKKKCLIEQIQLTEKLNQDETIEAISEAMQEATQADANNLVTQTIKDTKQNRISNGNTETDKSS